MPERNLVNATIALGLVALFVIANGCSRIPTSKFPYEKLVDRTGDLDWRRTVKDIDELEQQSYPRELKTNELLDVDPSDPIVQSDETDSDVARIVAVADQQDIPASEPIRLTAQALQNASKAAATEMPQASSETADVDRSQTIPPLKLDKVEPMEPPIRVNTEIVSSPAQHPPVASIPPAEVVSQPLRPLQNLESLKSTLQSEQQNRLRQVQLTTTKGMDPNSAPPSAEQPSAPEPSADPETLLPTPELKLASATMELPVIKTTHPSLSDIIVEPADFERPLKPCCDEPTCGPDCPSQANFAPPKPIKPLVKPTSVDDSTSLPVPKASLPDRVVIVATMSPDDIPPFAEPPVDDEVLANVQAERFDPMAAVDEFPNSEEFVADLIAQTPSLTNTESTMDHPKENPAHQQWYQFVEGNDPSCADCRDDMVTELSGTNKKPVKVIAEPETSFQPNFSPLDNVEPSVSSDSGNDFMATHQPAAEQKAAFVAEAAPKSEARNLITTPFLPFEGVETTPINPLPLPVPVPLPVNEKQPTTDGFAESKPDKADDAFQNDAMPITEQVKVEVIREVEIIDNTVPLETQIAKNIELLKAQVSVERDPQRRNGQEVNLRLLEVLQRQLAGLDDEGQSWSDQEKAYWQHQLDAINVMLGSSDENNTDLKRHEATLNSLDHLRMAVSRLESLANLKISNGAFCREVIGFGQFRAFTRTNFSPDQKLLLYCEVENFQSRKSRGMDGDRFETLLRGSYAIYDSAGQVVQQFEYPVVEDKVRNRRRDFYMYFPLQLKRLRPGNYRLELMVEDINGNKSASLPSMSFLVQ